VQAVELVGETRRDRLLDLIEAHLGHHRPGVQGWGAA
jgi:hypothetical protein